MKAVAYTPCMAGDWNEFVKHSKNGTFLFDRGFMDYHSDRFEDASLVFLDDKGNICGLLPANFCRSGHVVQTHGGLTYGGFVLGEKAVQLSVNRMLALAASYYAGKLGAVSMLYKPVPHIYHTLPAGEDLYALFAAGAQLSGRGVSSALCPASHPHQRQSRRGGVVKARKNGITIEQAGAQSSELKAFHGILSQVLAERHNAKPVHSLQEMQLLMQRFAGIKLFVAKLGDEVLSGVWMFETPRVAHTQYIATCDRGKSLGAGDLLIDSLVSEQYAGKPWFDFGISTERGGQWLNRGLVFEKEGFGGRTVCYDTYTLDLGRAIDRLKDFV